MRDRVLFHSFFIAQVDRQYMPPIPDAVAAAPEVHAVLLENATFRVLDVRVPPGAKTKMHSHPENVSYVLKGGKMRFIAPDGSTKEIELTHGQVTAPGPGAHVVENIGATEVQVIQVELKR